MKPESPAMDERAVEAAARSDAEFDGWVWTGISRLTRERYIARARAAITAYEAAKPVSAGDGINSPLNACCYREECRAALSRLASLEARSAEAVAGAGIVVASPYHGARFIIAYKGASLDGMSYPTAESAQAELDAICGALLHPALERARVEGLEAAAQYLEACDDYGDRHKATEIRALRKARWKE